MWQINSDFERVINSDFLHFFKEINLCYISDAKNQIIRL